ncbi:lamin tail domain-containing protein [bacterium]|nr:lamin tail domain-containing protein [bacterium]
MYKMNLVLLAVCLQASEIRVSEVMSNPQGSEYENEYVEIYNHSQDVIQINGWVLSDGNGVDTISHMSGPLDIKPEEYALILDPGYDFSAGLYNTLIPDSTPIYTIITDASFGSGGLANSGESVIIYSPDSTSISRMSWSSSSDNGYSWERVSMNSDDSLAIWQQSLIENGTPGYRNSVTLPLHNLSLDAIVVNSYQLGEPVEIIVTITNTGETQIAGFSMSIYRDDDQNSEQGDSEWELFLVNSTTIESQESLLLPITLFDLESGVQKGEIWVSAEGDEVRSDDTLRFQVLGAYPKDVISVTEIMFSPTSEQGGEWIEIKNVSTAAVSLQNWKLSDANPTRHPIIDCLRLLEPDSHLTLCAQNSSLEFFSLSSVNALVLDSWATLNSASDSVRLFDATGNLVTKSFYRGSWGNPGISLERRHPQIAPLASWNWAASSHPDGGTPSQINTQQLNPIAIQIDEIKVWTSNPIGPAPVALTIHFTNVGLDTLRLIQVASDGFSEWSGNLPSFESDSLNLVTAILEPGISDVLIMIYHNNDFLLADTSIQVILGFRPNRIALNEIHYTPDEDQVEFLEFANIGTDTLILNGWTFQDRSGTQGNISSLTAVPPDSLFLVCPDSISLSDWTIPQAKILEVSPWPSLNNSADSIIILDPLGNRQLAHGYHADQGGDPGKSMERLALWKPAHLDESWTTCIDQTGLTPGRRNSVLTPASNLSLLNIYMLDTLLWAEQNATVNALIVNAGVDPVPSSRITIEVYHGNELIVSSDQELLTLVPGDTLVWQSELEISECGWVDISAEIQYPDDDYIWDNEMSLKSYVSCNTTPMILNEIMPIPEADQSEWIEIYNPQNRSLDMQGWMISDNSLSPKVISDSSLVLAGNSYLILAGEPGLVPCPRECQIIVVEGFPSLNNTNDAVILFDPQGIPMDEMAYAEFTAMVEGRSLERIRSDMP